MIPNTTAKIYSIDLKNGSTALSHNMPHELAEWIYEENTIAKQNVINAENQLPRRTREWMESITKTGLKEFEASLTPEERQRFHLSVTWLYGAEEGLSIISSTTVCRLVKEANLKWVSDLITPWREEGESNRETLEEILLHYQDLLENEKKADTIIAQERDRKAALDTAEQTLNERIAAWNEQRKAQAEENATKDQQTIDKLLEAGRLLQEENLLLRKLLKNYL